MSELLFRSQRFLAGGPGLICMRSAFGPSTVITFPATST